MSRDLVLVDIRTRGGRRLRLEMFTRAPLVNMSLGGKHAPSVALTIEEARALRSGLDEFIDQIESEGGDPLLDVDDVDPTVLVSDPVRGPILIPDPNGGPGAVRDE